MSTNETTESTPEGFESFGLNAALQEGVKAAGFKIPSPIQQQAIPVILEGRDVIAQAQTGTGKTAAFGLPAMNRLDLDAGVGLLVIAPTRELAMQVSDEIYRLGRLAGVRTGTIYGGQSYTRQIEMVRRGVHALAATPGRLLDLLKSGKLPEIKPTMVVLDEADEMLDMGFLEDIQEIFTYLPEQRQTLLFSATMPEPIRKLASGILKDPVTIRTINTAESTNLDIQQLYCVIEEWERQDAVVRLIEEQCPDKAILFCRTRTEVDRLSNSLGACGYNAKPLHGDMEQPQRNEVMNGFRRGLIDILVATDVASRGLDVADVTHVFNYHMPFDSKSYVHRIGRTGRAGNKGTAITLVTPREYHQLERIQRNVGTSMENRLVPSVKQLRKSRMKRLQDELRHHTISPGAVTLVQELEEEMDLPKIACKLASLVMGQQAETGPDRIGVIGQRLEQLLNPRRRPAYGNRSYRPKPGGGRRDGRRPPQGGGRGQGNRRG